MSDTSYLDIRQEGALWRVELRGARGHALDLEALDSLIRLFRDAAAAGSPGILFTASGRSFCTGLDLSHCYALDRAAMRELMRRFHRAIAACLFYEGACVAAVGGHALAGGALLALACDRRILALGAGKVGIHGARMGLAYPDIAVEVVRHALSRKEAERALYGAGLVEAELAHRRGWSQELVEPASLEEAARSQLSLLRQAEGAFAANKRALLARCAIRVDTMDADGEDRFLDRWFAADTRERLTAALEALGRTGARAKDGEK